MIELIPAVFSSNFAIAGFPESMAVRLEAGTQLVVQQHYINTQTRPLRVRDVIHYEPLEAEGVETEIGFLGLSNIGFTARPGGMTETFEIECTVPFDMSVVMLGPHMHEWGHSIRVTLLDGTSEQELLTVPEWSPEYRDYPPISDMVDQPLALTTGQKIRLTCTFENTTDSDLTFPQEMCAVYGYYFPAAERSAWLCSGD